MSKAEQYEEKTEGLILPILEEMQFELVDVEYVKEGGTYYLRAYIDKEGGITINDCEAVARRMNDLLDQEDFIADSYVFEVSSPGLGRPLKKEKDFVRNMGEKVEIRTYRAIDRSKEFCGILRAYDKESVTIEDEDGKTATFQRADIALIRQAVDF
jgi:ribosome maturation factor RimP